MDVHLTRNRIMLSNKFWYFRFGLKQNDTEEDPGITQRWFETGIPKGLEKKKIYVPSAWNMYENRKDFYHFGTGWYETEFYVSEAWGASDGSKVSLVFSGSNYKTTVWVNGQLVGSHEGGYTKFWFEISPFVKFGSENKLVIQVDNRYQKERIPWFKASNWMNYGGIYRIVYLKLTPNICLGDFKITNEITFDKPVGEDIHYLKQY